MGFHVDLGEYDAVPPIDAVLVDHAPASINPDRSAIAAYLAFGRWASGEFRVPHRMGPATAAAIERDMGQVAIRPFPIEYRPQHLEKGLREVHVGFGPEAVRDDVPALSVLPASGWSGSLRALRSLAVASTAFALDGVSSGGGVSIRARLAVAVLFAGDLSADSLRVPGSGVDDAERERLAGLLLAARLGVSFDDGR